MKTPPTHFSQIRNGYLDRNAGPVRVSTIARLLRDQGLMTDACELESDARVAAPWCPKCERATPDPVMALATVDGERRVAFACPWCSSPEILKRWEAEGS